MSNAPSQDYPYSVEHTDIPSETLDIYHRALNGSEGTPYGDLELFDETDNYIFCRDFSESSDGKCAINYPLRIALTWLELRLATNSNTRKPRPG